MLPCVHVLHKTRKQAFSRRSRVAMVKGSFSNDDGDGNQGPVARSLVSANRWLRGIKMYRFPWYLTLVSTNHASSNPGQDVKKAVGLLRKTTTLHVHHAFLYISLPSLHDYDVKMPNCKFYGGRKQATANLFCPL